MYTPAQQTTNPETIVYSNIRGEATVSVSVFRAGGDECSIQVGNQGLDRGVLVSSDLGNGSIASQTLAVCQGDRNTAHIYYEDEQFKMRVSDRSGVTWMNTPASRELNPEGVNYSNQRGEQQVTVFFVDNDDSCSITIGNQPIENGKIQERTCSN